MDKIKEFLLDLFFPKFCLGCQKEGTYLCDDCRALLDIAEFDYCLCNTKPIRIMPLISQQRNGQTLRQAQGKCQRCRDKKLSGLFSALPYKEKYLTRKLIYQFKYQPYTKDLAKTLANILAEHFVISGKNSDEIWNNGVLIPVPLDKKKIKTRGYNQSEELANALSKILQIPVISDVLVKIKSTKPQMKLKKEEREKNLEGAFSISNRYCEENSSPIASPVIASPASRDEAISTTDSQQAAQSFDLRGKKIFLVDDVYTTGSTMEECARVLKQAGAKSVWGIAIAREE